MKWVSLVVVSWWTPPIFLLYACMLPTSKVSNLEGSWNCSRRVQTLESGRNIGRFESLRGGIRWVIDKQIEIVIVSYNESVERFWCSSAYMLELLPCQCILKLSAEVIHKRLIVSMYLYLNPHHPMKSCTRESHMTSLNCCTSHFLPGVRLPIGEWKKSLNSPQTDLKSSNPNLTKSQIQYRYLHFQTPPSTYNL